jgi:hypothetical protein
VIVNFVTMDVPVPHRRADSPKVVVVRRWAIGVLGSWKGRDDWVKGGANRVSLQAT